MLRLLLPGGIPILLAAAIVWITREISCRKLHDPFLHRSIVAATIFRLGVSFLLFGASRWHLPLFETYQLGDGFWNFAWDAKVYHFYGRQVAEAVAAGGFLPALGPEWPFVLYTAFLYMIFGARLLNAIVLNSLWIGLATLLAARIVRQFTPDRASGRAAAFSVLLWPSLFLWSTQAMKESVMIFLIFLLFYLVVSILGGAPRPAVRWTGLAVIAFLISLFRGYVGIGLSAAAAAVFLPMALLQIFRRSGARTFLCLGLLAAVSGPNWGGTRFSSKEILAYLNPVSPRVIIEDLPDYLGNLRKGIVHQSSASTVDPQVQAKSLPEIICYTPRVLAIFFFAPFPWQWGAGGNLRLLAGMESLLLYLLIPAMIRFLLLLKGRREPFLLFLLAFILLLAVPLGVVVPNLGTLFRLRIQLLIPLVVLLCTTGSIIKSYSFISFRNS